MLGLRAAGPFHLLLFSDDWGNTPCGMRPETRRRLMYCSAIASAALLLVAMFGTAPNTVASNQCRRVENVGISSSQAESGIPAIGLSVRDTQENDDDFAISHHRRVNLGGVLVAALKLDADRFRAHQHSDTYLARAPPCV